MPQKRTHIQPARKKRLPAYKSFRLTRTISPDKLKVLPTAVDLWKQTWAFLWKHRVKMLTFTFIYTLTYLIFVKGLNGFSLEVSSLKDELSSVASGNFGSIFTALSIYGSLLSSLVATPDASSNYFQAIILLTFSLAFIWLIRKLHGKNSNPSVKEAFYVGMRPLIPFLIVLFLMVLELLPAALGSFLMVTGQSTEVLAGSSGIIVLGALMVLTVTLSVYLLASSVFALYIVTLPKMTPVLAVRTSMNLLRIHKWRVLRKIIAFYLLLTVSGFILVLPFIIWMAQYAEVAFFVMGCASFGVMHTYMYKLYRSMIA